MLNLPEIFASEMARLGPFGAAPRLAVAVSGGADSTALALLARDWAAACGGNVLALIVDHGLRVESAPEAALIAERLRLRGIGSRILPLSGLAPPGLQAKARAARHATLAEAAGADGRLFLLLGHHAADQAETVAMRAVRGPQGAEGIAAWAARGEVVLLRPLLSVRPEALRDYLARQGVEWVEDPSNANPAFERVRIRQAGTLAEPSGAAARRESELQAADFLAAHCTIRPEGFALIDAPAAPPAALAALIRIISGATYAPRRDAVAALAAKLRQATLGGARLSAAGRLGPGWLLTREAAAMAPPVQATPDALWDSRFLLQNPTAPGQEFGALGAGSSKFSKFNGLSNAVLRAMPCLRTPGGVITFPVAAKFVPPAPAAPHPFFY